MMITLWHQTTQLVENSCWQDELIPIAIFKWGEVSRGNLGICSSHLNRLLLESSIEVLHQLMSPSRQTSIGDVLSQDNGKCWKISESDLIALDFSLPHVAISVFPELGDPFESFPTLHFDRDWGDSILLDSIDLPSYADGHFYLETRQWQDSTYQLLRSYK
jgi:hypothetical protein